MSKALLRQPLPGAASRVVVPCPSPLIISLRKENPLTLLKTITLAGAANVIADWEAARSDTVEQGPSEPSQTQYRRTATTLIARYEREAKCEPDELSPLLVVEALFEHCRTIGKASWSTYRSALLWHFEQIFYDYKAQGWPANSYVLAVAVLIVVSKKPLKDERRRQTKPAARVRRLMPPEYSLLLERLGQTSAKMSVAARSWAIASVETGVQPSEWRGASLGTAETADMPDGEDPSAWLVLTVASALDRRGDRPEFRRLLVKAGDLADHVQATIAVVAKTLLIRPRSRKRDPFENHVKTCSGIIYQCCKTLWPKQRGRWLTLISLCNQAHVNFYERFEPSAAASMIGTTNRRSHEGRSRNRTVTNAANNLLVLPTKVATVSPV